MFLIVASLMACDSTLSDESQAIILSSEIPNIEILENDIRLSHTNDGTVYLDSSMFSGYQVSYYPDGSLKTKKGYFEGRLEGNYMTYYPSGGVYSQRPYFNGVKHGEHLGYYESGLLKFQYYFVNGFSQGTHMDWYPKGNKKKEMNYVDGKELGAQKYWRRDGKLRSNYVVRENGRRYGMLGLKRCAKIDSESGNIDPYTGQLQ